MSENLKYKEILVHLPVCVTIVSDRGSKVMVVLH